MLHGCMKLVLQAAVNDRLGRPTGKCVAVGRSSCITLNVSSI